MIREFADHARWPHVGKGKVDAVRV